MRTSADIRHANSLAIARAIHARNASARDTSARDPSTRRSVAKDTGLSITNAAATCADWIDRGILYEPSQMQGSAGRPIATVALNPDQGAFVGVEIADAYVRAETFDSALQHLTDTSLDIRSRDRGFGRVAARVQTAIEQEQRKHESLGLLGIGVAAPTQISHETGGAPAAPDSVNTHLLGLLHGANHVRVLLRTPHQALANTELWSRRKRSRQNFVVVNLGTEVGIGIAIDGHVQCGNSNAAGEWGHSVLEANGRICRCGARGCIEAYIGAAGMIQTLHELQPADTPSSAAHFASAIAGINEAALAGDAAALDVVRHIGRHLGLALGSLMNVLNPKAIVISGWVGLQMGKVLLEAAMPHVRQQALSGPLLAAKFHIASPREDGVTFGMAALAFEEYLKTSLGLDKPVGSRRLVPGPRQGESRLKQVSGDSHPRRL